MIIQEANSQQELERDRLTAEAWGEHLSLDAYMAREHTLRQTEFGQTRRTWIASVPEVPGEVVCSCESYETFSWVKGKKVRSLGLASVYTEPKFRGKGYASQMLPAVAQRLRKEYPDADYWVGFSEVGAAIYERVGFFAARAFEWTADLSDASIPPVHVDIRFLTQVEVLEETYSGKKNWFSVGSEAEKGNCDAVSFDPKQAIWIWERETVYRKARGRMPAHSHGATLGGSSLFWTLNHKADELWILNVLSSSSPADAKNEVQSLLHAAIHSVQGLGMRKIILWNEFPFSNFENLKLDAAMKWKKSPQQDSIPILMPLKEGLDASRVTVIPMGAWL